jgi:hypothetical protein
VTKTRYDYNYSFHIWFKPESYCLECAPADFLNYPPVNVCRLPPDAIPLLNVVCAAASDERVFLDGYGDEGEMSIESAAEFMDKKEMREHKRIRKQYLLEMKRTFENGRSVPKECAEYRCTDEALLSEEPQGYGYGFKESKEPEKQFSKSFDADVLNNWVQIKY